MHLKDYKVEEIFCNRHKTLQLLILLSITVNTYLLKAQIGHEFCVLYSGYPHKSGPVGGPLDPAPPPPLLF